MKNNTGFWDQRRGKIFSSKGGWKIGQGIFNHGYSMMDDFVGKTSYMQVVMLNATGRLPERPLADWVEAVFICLSWPDPRIWCNQIGALAGTMQTSAMAATCAGTLATDARAYGVRPLIEGLAFIQHACLDSQAGKSIEEIVLSGNRVRRGKPEIMGYARPIAKGDERIAAMERVTEQLDFDIGEHLTLAYRIEDYLATNYNESMNINGYVSAFLSDQGFTGEEAYRMYATLVSSGVTACYVDTRDKIPNSFLPLRCDDIDYQGVVARDVPDRN